MTVVTPPYVPPRYWGRRILLAALGLLLLIWAAPVIAAWTPFVSWMSGKASDSINGSVTVGSASLGWFSPIILSNVEVRDADDQLVAQVPRIEGDRSLLMILIDPSDL